jgi:hypothetical protein
MTHNNQTQKTTDEQHGLHFKSRLISFAPEVYAVHAPHVAPPKSLVNIIYGGKMEIQD